MLLKAVFAKFLTEQAARASQKSSSYSKVLAKAAAQVSKAPFPVNTSADALMVTGIGQHIARLLVITFDLTFSPPHYVRPKKKLAVLESPLRNSSNKLKSP